MQLTLLSISSLTRTGLQILGIVISWITISCANQPALTEKKASEIALKKTTNQKVYAFSYDSVWRATQLALKYPIAINNMDHGVLETEWIKALDGFVAPGNAREPSSGIRYKIAMTLVKGKLDGRESVRVTIDKKMERQRDFFSEPEQISSDGLEEKIIFYRIEREILIDEGLKKAANQK